MHSKFRQGSSETLKDFPLGQPSLDSHVYQRQNNSTGAVRQVHKDGQAYQPFTILAKKTLGDLEENTPADIPSFFEGFLAIGTLGTDAINSEPETPTFAESFEKLAEKDNELTENELRLINDELEKVLAAAEAKEDGWTDSSGRNSHVSNGRISHASSITLSGKPLAIPETTGTGNLACPLQGYLLGSAVECPEKATLPKKEHRTSLAELFDRHKAEETSEAKWKQREKREEYKEHDNTTMNLMKKILKKKIADGSFRSSSASAETKLFKILHKFQKKVHPECSTSTQKSEKSRKIRIKDMIPCNAGYDKEGRTDESMENFSQKAFRDENPPKGKHGFKPMQFVAEGNDSNGSRECWIKTDSDYLVLEL